MPRTNFKELLDAGVHFGHLKRKWNPAMAPYIFMERNGIHIIDLNKTVHKIDEAANALNSIAKSGRKILFVATKKQAKELVSEKVSEVNMPYVTERWPGGMLTNFPTIRKTVKKMKTIDKMATDGTFENMSKRERLQITRQREKLEKTFGSIVDLNRLPAALFIVDINKEHIAVAEARILNIPIFAMVDTNTNPNLVDFAIPSNDDAQDSISKIVGIMTDSIKEGLSERKALKDKEVAEKAANKAKKEAAEKVAAEKKADAKKEEVTEEKAEEEKPAEKKTVAKKAPAKKTAAKKETTAKKETAKKEK